MIVCFEGLIANHVLVLTNCFWSNTVQKPLTWQTGQKVKVLSANFLYVPTTCFWISSEKFPFTNELAAFTSKSHLNWLTWLLKLCHTGCYSTLCQHMIKLHRLILLTSHLIRVYFVFKAILHIYQSVSPPNIVKAKKKFALGRSILSHYGQLG